MTDAPETPAARSRRRWITLGEIIGILALAISAASWWDAHQEKAREAAPVAVAAAPLVLTASADAAHAVLSLKPARADQVIQTQTLYFPAAVHPGSVATTGNARIEAGWFDGGLVDAIGAGKAAAEASSHRLAVGIETVFVDGAQERTDRAVYDIGYRLHPRLLRSTTVQLEGISLVRHNVGGDLQQRLDARWAAQTPKPQPKPKPSPSPSPSPDARSPSRPIMLSRSSINLGGSACVT